MAESKKFHQSKTIQMNTLAPLLSYGLTVVGLEVPAEVQVSILAVANWILRTITRSAIA